MKKHLTVFEVVLYSCFGLLALITLYPFYNVLIVSFSNTVASAKHTPYLWFYAFDLSGYKTIIHDKYFFKSFATSVFVTVVGTTLNMVLSVTGAYVLSRRQLVGRRFFLTAILFTMLFSGGLIPTYLVVSGYGLVNSVWAMIFPCMISTYYLIIMKNYFNSLPASLEEAAVIDGASYFTVLVRIFIPISTPFMATFALFYAVERWNEWWNAFLYINKKDLKPLQIYLRDVLVNFNTQLTTQAQAFLGSQNKLFIQSVQMATIIIATLPILVVYPFVQKYFVKGVMIGAVKE